jgi:ribosomal protein S6--L-glutamate ligase
MDTLAFAIEVEPENPDLYFRGKPVTAMDAVVPRIGASITFFGTAVVRQFEQMGVFCLNSSQAISVSRDKLRSLQILSRHRIGIPETAFVHDLKQVVPTIRNMEGPPIVIKLLQGTQGTGVILAETMNTASSVVEALQGAAQQNVLLQRFVKESKGRDVRAFVVGNRVVAAMRRTAQGDEFRSNVHKGGSVAAVALDKDFESVALHAAQIMGLRVAGVDMLESADGPVVMEVNSSPGLEGIERATGVDVAGAIIDQIEEEVLFPEIDIRQRLTLQSGYGVMEVPVTEDSELVGKTIAGSGLKERDVMVLTIHRGSVSIPNPRGSREVLSGDILLCFGKSITLKSLAPRESQKRTRKKRRSPVKGSSGGASPVILTGDEPVSVADPAADPAAKSEDGGA